MARDWGNAYVSKRNDRVLGRRGGISTSEECLDMVHHFNTAAQQIFLRLREWRTQAILISLRTGLESTA